MTNSDDKVERALKAASNRELPGTEFTEKVMTEIEGGGGVREISARLPGRNRTLLGLAAAAVLGIMIGAGFVTFGTGGGMAGADPEAAAGPPVDLPAATTGSSRPRLIVITIDADGVTWLRGRQVPTDQLRARLASAVSDHRNYSDPFDTAVLPVLIRADRGVSWASVRGAMQTCAASSVNLRNLYFATAEKKAIPVYFPVQRDAMNLRTHRTQYTVRLVRDPDAAGTRVSTRAWGPSLGVGRAGVTALEAQFRRREAGAEVVTIDAGDDVPFGDVAGAVDALRRTGVVHIRFTGALTTKIRAVVTNELIDSLKEEVKPDIIETRPIEQDRTVIEDPVIKDAKVSDHNERDR